MPRPPHTRTWQFHTRTGGLGLSDRCDRVSAMSADEARPGATNSLLDVEGLRIGHAERTDEGWLTGTTVVLTGDEGCVAGVDVRGGGPGTRETDALHPCALIERVHAVVLTGGSAFGLGAADGVMARLLADGVGYPVGGPGQVVPIVPAAVIFDLGRGGGFEHYPTPELGAQACENARRGGEPQWGNVGAGAGAVAGGLKGGVGSASAILNDDSGHELTVGALVVVNAAGSCVDPGTGRLYAERHCLPGDLPELGAVDPEQIAQARLAAERLARPGSFAPALATTIAVIGTNATLTKAQCTKVAGIGHDGMARAIQPVHTMIDGDTVFTVATGAGAAPDPLAFHLLLQLASDCLTRAIARALLASDSVRTPAGAWRCYREAFSSAFGVGTR